ncbi:MAG: putative O-glycosylation ligase, exosortase A system-associated [Rhodospirillales bacterium]
MLRSILLLFVYISFLGLGASAPFILALGYVWVDTFRPQEVAYIILNQLPVAMIMGAAAMGAYLVFDRKDPPKLTLAGATPAILAVWSTVAMAWSVAGDFAWVKWDWAFKVLMFAAFLPYVIRSRVQIEAMAQVYLCALAGNIIPFGVKTIISGGGYGQNLGLGGGNSGLGEGGQLSTFCLMAVPIAYYLSRNAQLIPRNFVTSMAYKGILVLSAVTAIGTFQRSALVGAGVLGIYMFMRSRQKVLFGSILGIATAVLLYTASGSYMNRMNTIGTYQADSSAMVRVMVWKWTLAYVASHPLGGGFNSYIINVIELPGDGENPPEVQHGRAFHSSYFEVLGELGIPGFALFIVTIATTILSLRRLAKRTRNVPHLAWCAELSDALQSGIMVFMASGAFVGIAFQPILWYFLALTVSLREYVRRVNALSAKTVDTSWRGRGKAPSPASTPAGALPSGPGWRQR